MDSQILSIRGMTCATCAQRIEKTLGKLAGIGQATVNLASEKLFVEYDNATVQLSTIKEAVAKMGFEVAEQTTDTKLILPIGGMSCAACAQRVEKSIGKLEGVSRVSVNFATEKASIVYNPRQLRLSTIRETIEKTGYKVLEINKSDAADEDRARKQKEIKTLRTKFAIAAVFSLPLLYIAMVPMLPQKKISPGSEVNDQSSHGVEIYIN